MPLILCPKCGSRSTVATMPPGRVRCPKPDCREVFTPVAAPEPSARPNPPKPAPTAYFIRKAGDPDMVVGPLESKRLDELIGLGKFSPNDEFSTDRVHWAKVSTRADAPIEIDD